MRYFSTDIKPQNCLTTILRLEAVLYLLMTESSANVLATMVT